LADGTSCIGSECVGDHKVGAELVAVETMVLMRGAASALQVNGLALDANSAEMRLAVRSNNA